MTYYYGYTIKAYRHRSGWSQKKLAEHWPKKEGSVGVHVNHVQNIENGKTNITDIRVLRALCTLLDIPTWEFGLADYDPFNPKAVPPPRGLAMYEQTISTVSTMIHGVWIQRRTLALQQTESSVKHLNGLLTAILQNTPPPQQFDREFQKLRIQVIRLNAILDVEHQRYTDALDKFREMNSLAESIEDPASIALSLLGIGTELDRAERHEEAISYLEIARDVSFGASKHVAALTNAYLARIYASNQLPQKFERAIKTALDIAKLIDMQYSDGTDYVFHSISGIMAEQSYGYLALVEPKKVLALKEAISQQILIEGNVWLDAWIPLDWARAYLLLGDIPHCVEAGEIFYKKACAIQSPHATSRAYRLLQSLDDQNYGERPEVVSFRTLMLKQSA